MPASGFSGRLAGGDPPSGRRRALVGAADPTGVLRSIAMTSFTVLLSRSEDGQGPVRLSQPVVPDWLISPEQMAAWCRCPIEALQIDRAGPVYFAHGGEWAKARELTTLRWPLLYPHGLPLEISGPAVAVRPSRRQRGSWRALTSNEAANAYWVLRWHQLPIPLNEPADLWLRRQLHAPQLNAYYEAKWRGDEAAMLQIRAELMEQQRQQAREVAAWLKQQDLNREEALAG